MVFSGDPALAGLTVDAGKGDSLLNDSKKPPCTASPDYTAGVDADGNPVVPADAGTATLSLPDQIAVPLKTGGRAKDSAYVSLDGKKLAPLLNPPPCRPNHN